jgi:hypothetical protein
VAFSINETKPLPEQEEELDFDVAGRITQVYRGLRPGEK